MTRFLTLLFLGLLLLGGSVVGARWASGEPWPYVQMPTTAPPAPTAASEPAAPPVVVSWGHVDVEKGTADLHPKQMGTVEWVVAEFDPATHTPTKVKKGDVLLKVDDQLARLKTEEAQADVRAAQEQLKQAEQLPRQYKLKAAQQARGIDALRHNRTKVQQETEAKLKTYEAGSALRRNVAAAIEETLKQLDALIDVEESKLAELRLFDPQSKIREAQADLLAKQTRLKAAETLLQDFRVVAPEDGTILRVNVRAGEVLGPNPKAAAIQFVPDTPLLVRAEVLQEWSHRVAAGQEVTIEDDVQAGPTWTGKVRSLSGWIARTRSPVIEPFMYNDVRTRECLITIDGNPTDLAIGQRVRARIKIKG
jgi:multidrug resistance efflux pump